MNGKRILSIFALVGLLALATGWIIAPRTTGIHPQGEELHGRQPIMISFSKAMTQASVEENFSTQPHRDGSIQWDPSQQEMTFVPHQSWPSDTQITVSISGGRSTLRLPLLNPQSWTLTVSPYLLTYLYPADGESNLFSLNTESGVSEALTDLPTGILDYDLSPDGLTIYYSATDSEGTSRIFGLDRASGQARTLLTCPEALCRNPQISPAADWIAYQHIPNDPARKPDIHLYDLERGEAESIQEENHHLEHPLWSSQGWLAYYNRTDQAYIFTHLKEDETVRIANETGAEGTWAPDGEQFLTTEILDLDEELAPRHLFLYEMHDGSKTDLTEDLYLEDANPSYSPQGRVVAFGRKSLLSEAWTPGRQLWLLDRSAGDTFALTDDVDYHHSAFAWHPDGEELAYVRYNQAQLAEAPEIWLIDINDQQKARLVINAFAPRWIP